MRIADITELREHLDELVEHLDDTPIVIMKDDQPIAALVAVCDDDDVERLALSLNPDFRALIRERREEVRRTGGMSSDEFWAAVEARYGGEAEDAAGGG